ncbi:MAG: hypothetical protein KGQ93_04065 [Cyanobacteria bacterium REEB459]|nr:hypothetical protein [Cyanobacteria bacterium REEB459]
MDKIKDQTHRVMQLIFSRDTADIYQKTLSRSWEILREAGLLIWLVICLVLVGGEWFYRNSIRLGSQTRSWYQNLTTGSGGADIDAAESMGNTGQALLNRLRSAALYLLEQARQQLAMGDPGAAPAADQQPDQPVSTPTPPIVNS